MPPTVAVFSSRRAIRKSRKNAMACPPWIVVDFEQLPAVSCPCGTSQRALADAPQFPGTIHRTEIGIEAKPHFHRRLTETYYILRCDDAAAIELDGQRVAVRPGMLVVIPPNVVHRAVARMTILNIVFPKFDPTDEVVIED
jgi:mannose-6-phosphate isomerase-like protein (cupin superfamily)